MEYLYAFLIGWGTELAFGLRVLTTIVLALFVIPLQVKEALVKNGLRQLRIQMLIIGAVFFVSNNLMVVALYEAIFRDIPTSLTAEFAQLVNSIVYLILAIDLNIIYREQFNAKQKHIHSIAQKIEAKERRAYEKKQ